MTGYIEPPNPRVAADYWVTRRSADAAPGYDLGLPDLRARYHWNGNGAWITGYRDGIRGRAPNLSCLHSNNGWRVEGPAATDIFDALAAIARVDAETIRAKWESMPREEQLARQRHEWEQAKLLGSGISGPALREYQEAKGRQ